MQMNSVVQQGRLLSHRANPHANGSHCVRASATSSPWRRWVYCLAGSTRLRLGTSIRIILTMATTPHRLRLGSILTPSTVLSLRIPRTLSPVQSIRQVDTTTFSTPRPAQALAHWARRGRSLIGPTFRSEEHTSE